MVHLHFLTEWSSKVISVSFSPPRAKAFSFFGRKPDPRFQGEAVSDYIEREINEVCGKKTVRVKTVTGYNVWSKETMQLFETNQFWTHYRANMKSERYINRVGKSRLPLLAARPMRRLSGIFPLHGAAHKKEAAILTTSHSLIFIMSFAGNDFNIL